jgi:hypothetical protein
LEKDELEKFRVVLKNREQNDDGEDDSDGSNECSNEDSEPNGSNEEQRTSGASSDEDVRILHESIKLE